MIEYCKANPGKLEAMAVIFKASAPSSASK
jgi:hypothetical protein